MWSCRRKRRGGKTELEESKFRAAAVRKARGAGAYNRVELEGGDSTIYSTAAAARRSIV